MKLYELIAELELLGQVHGLETPVHTVNGCGCCEWSADPVVTTVRAEEIDAFYDTRDEPGVYLN